MPFDSSSDYGQQVYLVRSSVICLTVCSVRYAWQQMYLRRFAAIPASAEQLYLTYATQS